MNRNLHNAVRCVDGKRERDDFKVLVFVGERERERERESFQLLARRDPEKERDRLV